MIKLVNTRFNQSIAHNPKGSTFLGYLYAELSVKDGIAPGVDLEIGMPDLQVRITRNGKPRVDFPTDLKEIDGVERRVARYFTASAASRDAVTAAAFGIPEVSCAVEIAERSRAAA